MEEVTMQSKNLNAPPEPTSPPEFEPSSAQTRRSRSDRKTISLASSAGLGRRIRVKTNDYYPKRKEIPDEDWFKEGEDFSAEEKNINTNTNTKQEVKAPSFWQRTKSKIGNVLKTVGLVGALAGGAKYAHEHTEVAKAGAIENQKCME
jgi:hypothetical protein